MQLVRRSSHPSLRASLIASLCTPSDESKTRLICHAAADPEDIFFPDAADILASEDNVLAQEMIGDVLQDLEAPYRPNVSSYTSTQVQDTLASAVEEVQKGSKADQPAFKSLAIFTGQDEQFAYKRALSRIYEITSKEFVRCAKHTPIPPQDRVWEHSNAKPTHYSRAPSSGFTPPASPEPIISADDADISSTARKYPRGTKVDPSDPEIDVSELPKPKIGTPHFWGVVDSWGKKAGRWGLGVEAKKEGGKS
jgi:peroxisome-assembly ATPase